MYFLWLKLLKRDWGQHVYYIRNNEPNLLIYSEKNLIFIVLCFSRSQTITPNERPLILPVFSCWTRTSFLMFTALWFQVRLNESVAVSSEFKPAVLYKRETLLSLQMKDTLRDVWGPLKSLRKRRWARWNHNLIKHETQSASTYESQTSRLILCLFMCDSVNKWKRSGGFTLTFFLLNRFFFVVSYVTSLILTFGKIKVKPNTTKPFLKLLFDKLKLFFSINQRWSSL